MKLNEILTRQEQGECLLLQLRNTSDLVKLSKVEFEIIVHYSRVLNKQEVIHFFKDQIVMSEEQLDELLTRAKQVQLLVDPTVLSPKRFAQVQGKRKKAIWEVLTLDFTNRRLERLGEKKKLQDFSLVFFACLATVVLLYLSLHPFAFVEQYKRILYLVPYSFSNLLIFIYIGALLSMVIHELGHYYFYKRCHGQGSVFGIGLLLFVIPVFYNKLYISQVESRNHRMLIYAGGFIFDFFLVLFLLGSIALLHDRAPVVVFLGYSMLISVFIRSLFNLNFFLPQTDAYYLVSDWLREEQLFRVSSLRFFGIFKGEITLKYLLYGSYFLLSCVSILGAWICFALPLLLLVYYVLSI